MQRFPGYWNTAADTPFGDDVRIRQAFAKSIDRDGINQVVFEGRFIPNNQTEAARQPLLGPGPSGPAA